MKFDFRPFPGPTPRPWKAGRGLSIIADLEPINTPERHYGGPLVGRFEHLADRDFLLSVVNMFEAQKVALNGGPCGRNDVARALKFVAQLLERTGVHLEESPSLVYASSLPLHLRSYAKRIEITLENTRIWGDAQ